MEQRRVEHQQREDPDSGLASESAGRCGSPRTRPQRTLDQTHLEPNKGRSNR